MIYTLLYRKLIINKDLLYITGKSNEYYVMTYVGNNLKRNEYMYIYIYINCFTLLYKTNTAF